MATKDGASRAPSNAKAPSVGDLSYAEAGNELDGIIDEFETGVVDVDRLVEQLERATDIVDELDRRLRRTRLQVEELVPRLEAIGRRDQSAGDDVVDEDASEDADEGEETGSGEDSGDGSSGLF